MHSRFLYLFIVATLTATPALAADDATAPVDSTAGAAPIAKMKETDNQMPEAPPEESRIQVPDTPHQLHTQSAAPDAKDGDKNGDDKNSEGGKGKDQAKADAKANRDVSAVASIPSLIVSLTPGPAIEKEKESSFILGLSDEKKNALAESNLEDKGAGKITLLAVDESMMDYQHLQATVVGDKWGFSFTPHTAHNYRLWVDVTPKDKPEQILPVPMKGKQPCEGSCFDKTVSLSAEFGKNKAAAGLVPPLTAGISSTLTLALTDAKGAPLNDLDPVAGSYAYVAAFIADGTQMIPVMRVPSKPDKESKPGMAPLAFTLQPQKPGLVKIFVEVRRNGKNILLPFTAQVADAPRPPK